MNHLAADRIGICFMNSNVVWGGGEKWHFEAACHFRDQGFSVLVITNKGSELYSKLIDQPGISVESKRITNSSFINPFKIAQIRKLLIKNKISAIFLGLPIDVKVGGLAAKSAGTKTIIYRRGTAVAVKNSFSNRFLFRSVLTGVITNSREIRDKIFLNNPKMISDEKIHIVYNGVDPDFWSEEGYSKTDNLNSRPLILGNAGRLVEQKGQKYLIQIARHLKERHVDFRLYIAGSGELEKSLKLECKENQLEQNIIFLKFVDNMKEFLAKLDIYLSTSIHEGSSNVIIEAMAMGKPVIAFKVSSMPELVEDKKTGYLIPLAETQPFAEKIVFLKNNPAELDNFGANARKKVEREFDFARNMQEIIKIISERQ